MSPLAEISADVLRQMRVVLSDIDDTLTLDGRVPAVAYAAMEALREEGLLMIPITGRPAGWCDHIARMWPVDGIVGENGAFYFHYSKESRKMIRRYWKTSAERSEDAAKLQELKTTILAGIPGAAVASDQAYREADLAIDFCEDVLPLPKAEVKRIVSEFSAAGATAKISSIHVNGWFGDYDKLSMTRRLLSEVFSIGIDDDAHEIVFIGDSPNDAPMFDFFPVTVGVKNIEDSASEISTQPTFVTNARGGLGFAELAETILEARRA